MQVKLDQIDPDAIKVVERLRRFGHEAYLVGGCVRDLLLGLPAKDFDVATSATPPELRRAFRNCRIIGRRFRLAHIFFGSKIIETSTFRANPREGEDDETPQESTEAEGGNLLIRRDNVFGTAEEDARRRDFTVNGLFLDVEAQKVIDHVEGLADIEAKVVRTIGDPDVRFREDPIRILRAVKFAARCGLTIEPETYRHAMGHASEITKCAHARVSEEFFRLLRAGAARPSMELLIEMKLLGVLLPALNQWLGLGAGTETAASSNGGGPENGFEGANGDAQGEAPEDDVLSASDAAAASEGNAMADFDSATMDAAAPGESQPGAELGERGDTLAVTGGETELALFWSYLRAMDEAVKGRRDQPNNGAILAVIVLPRVRAFLGPRGRAGRGDTGYLVTQALRPVVHQLRVSRRDAENARQILLLLRHFLQDRGRRPRVGNRDLAAGLRWLLQVLVKAENLDATLLESLDEAPPPPRTQGAIVTDLPAPVRAADGLHPIPALPADLVSAPRPVFLGTGAFGPAIAASWRAES
jgi:poly(A) polymerase